MSITASPVYTATRKIHPPTMRLHAWGPGADAVEKRRDRVHPHLSSHPRKYGSL